MTSACFMRRQCRLSALIQTSCRSDCARSAQSSLRLTVSGCGINTIPTLEEQAKGAWSQVQNQYQRRAELIPNLVETVKGFAKQEREVLTQVIEARAKATQIQVNADQLTDPEAFRRFQEAQQQLSGALGRLIAVSENYPELKSNQNFLALQSQLEGTENRIAVARRDYIQAVQAYNTEVADLPRTAVGDGLWRKADGDLRGRRRAAEAAAGEILDGEHAMAPWRLRASSVAALALAALALVALVGPARRSCPSPH